ncbi:MAG: DegT/DnrJ/EryC1/StrS family aminotransferase [Magnetospirillum sp.]|nr:DegT/DnrJ/EryC1/StrS family aminotransferase [Magnetospirillum sp.]
MSAGTAPNLAAIPLVDLRAQHAALREEIVAGIEQVLVRSDFIHGGDVGRFEEEFAAACGAGHGIGCGNGTDALHLAVRALDIGPGDEVIVPAMTFVATALGVSLAGATPVLVDVDPNTALIDPTRLEAAITAKTKAIIAVHLYGQCADMTAIAAIASRHGLAVIEDAAQAHGASHHGRPAGSLATLACFSFYPGKNLGACGDGGMVVAQDPALAARLRRLSNLGSERKYHHEEIAPNSRLDTVQAAVLRVKLKWLPEWTRLRRSHAAAYDSALAPIERIQKTTSDEGSVYHLYVVRSNRRDADLAALNQAGLGAGIHYPFALHQLGAYRHLGYAGGSFPIAEDWAARCLSLPIYAELPTSAFGRAATVLSQAA